MAYGTAKWGVHVTCGDIDGDGYEEIITGAGPGAVFGPHVRGWNHDGGSGTTAMPGVSYFAYNSRHFGVNPACGDLDGDPFEEIVTGPGPGRSLGAHVRGWNYDNIGISPINGMSFMAYSTLYGAVVSAGDVDDDGKAEILTMPGPGPSYTAHAMAWRFDQGTVTPVEFFNFRAYDKWMKYGGNIAGGTLQ
jgi:hypothetical protein